MDQKIILVLNVIYYKVLFCFPIDFGIEEWTFLLWTEYLRVPEIRGHGCTFIRKVIRVE